MFASTCPHLLLWTSPTAPNVSDGGLLSLVLPQDHSGASDPRFGQCRGLARLLVSGCQTVTRFPCSELLVSLDKLTAFDYPDTVGVLNSLVMDLTICLTPDSVSGLFMPGTVAVMKVSPWR